MALLRREILNARHHAMHDGKNHAEALPIISVYRLSGKLELSRDTPDETERISMPFTSARHSKKLQSRDNYDDQIKTRNINIGIKAPLKNLASRVVIKGVYDDRRH